MACYILIIKEINAVKLIKLFILYIIKDFGIPVGITSDRGLIFISEFWLILYFYLKVKRRLNIIFYL